MLDSTQPIPKVGVVSAKESVHLVPRVSGYLTKMAFQEGGFVKEGDLLFEIEDTVYKINVKIAEALIQQIEADVALAKLNLERTQNLVSQNVSRKQELDDAQRTVSLHEGRLKEAEARLEQAENDLSYTKIYAPLNGRIGAKQISVGNYLTPASGVLATIRQFDPITVEFSVTEREYMNYFHSNGETRQAKIEILLADGTPYDGEFHIDFRDNYVDRSSGLIMVYLLCKNEAGKLYPGGYTTVKLSEQFAEPKPAVSVTALMTDGAAHYVYVVKTVDGEGGNKAHLAEKRPVTTGPLVFGQQIITSGLTPGEMVVVGGMNKIMMSGQPITPVPTPALMQQMQAAQGQQTPQEGQQETQEGQQETAAGSETK
jgi:RND family efflux transporter MFP subunit